MIPGYPWIAIIGPACRAGWYSLKQKVREKLGRNTEECPGSGCTDQGCPAHYAHPANFGRAEDPTPAVPEIKDGTYWYVKLPGDRTVTKVCVEASTEHTVIISDGVVRDYAMPKYQRYAKRDIEWVELTKMVEISNEQK